MKKLYLNGPYGLCWAVLYCLLSLSPAHSNSKVFLESELAPELRLALSKLQRELGTSLYYTSGYRPPTHPIEAIKPKPGTHARRIAVDIACNGNFISCDTIHTYALKHFDGIGRYNTHIHLDLRGYPARWDKRTNRK